MFQDGSARVFEPGSGSPRVSVPRAAVDLDVAADARGRAELARVCADPQTRWALVLLGPRRFVDPSGLRLLLDATDRLHERDAGLMVVAPPYCLLRMLDVFGMTGALATADDAWAAAEHVLGER